MKQPPPGKSPTEPTRPEQALSHAVPTPSINRETEHAVVVSTRIEAERSTVWSFFSDPTRFAAWIGAFAGGPALPGTAIDPCVGGAVAVEYPHSAGARGEIVEMQAPRRIVFTWGYQDGTHGMAAGASRVEITLAEETDGTRVELRHTGIPSAEARSGHRGGWTHYVSVLARNALEAQHAQRLPRIVHAYFSAWREADEAARMQLLEECCEADVQIRTSFAHTNDIAELSEHIANALRHMPGMRLAPAHSVQHMQGFARVDWTVSAPDGTVAVRGTNVFVLSPRTRLTAVVSFPAAG